MRDDVAGPRDGARPAGRRPRAGTVLAVALAVQLVTGLAVVAGDEPPFPTSSTAVASVTTTASGVEAAAPVAAGPDAALASAPEAAAAPGAQLLRDAAPLVVPDPGPATTPASRSSRAAGGGTPTTFTAAAPESAQAFAREHPAHAAATQRDGDPASFHWAVIVGINDYMGRTSSTIGSVSDALVLRDTLLQRGWRGDQVLTLTDHAATHDQVVRAIEWLIRSTDHRSTVVFSFSGHMRHESGVTALWPADNRFLWAGDLSRMLGAVPADRMWVSLQGCHAVGLAAPGMEGPTRLVTYSSHLEEKAYEDPSTGHSVMGYYLFAEGLRDGWGDRAGNGDGRVTVQEAFAWAAPRATSRTEGQQPYGPQRPVMVDGLGGRGFPIAVTGPPAPAAAPAPAGSPDDGGETRRRWWEGLPNAEVPDLPDLDVPDLVPDLALPGRILR